MPASKFPTFTRARCRLVLMPTLPLSLCLVSQAQQRPTLTPALDRHGTGLFRLTFDRRQNPLRNSPCSIVSRQSPGRPGSRRHQRWINEMQLKQPIEPDELRSLFLVTTESSFSFLWAGGGQAAKV